MLSDILQQLLGGPRSLPDLAVQLKQPREMVELALRQLLQRGYVDQAYEGAAHCPSCGGCSMKRLCPSQGNPQPTLEVWRLTPRGQRASV